MEEGNDFGEKVGWCTNSETARVDDEVKNAIDGRNSHVEQFVPKDGVLVPLKV